MHIEDLEEYEKLALVRLYFFDHICLALPDAKNEKARLKLLEYLDRVDDKVFTPKLKEYFVNCMINRIFETDLEFEDIMTVVYELTWEYASPIEAALCRFNKK